ncbi:MAG: molybdopterin molybdotransferase MoeA [Bacteroidetes bacterium]|nr:molybdopterin molybdotransferase MoeA [Bacteroidota bacterium]
MIFFEEALKIVMAQPVFPAIENISLAGSSGRILAEDIVSDIDMPPFDKSAVDGFACRMEDLQTTLPAAIIETILAGIVPQKTIVRGTCSRIMTGAMVPRGADCVVMVEDTVEQAGDKVAFTKEKTGKNICFKGEDIRLGEIVLEKGIIIKSAQIAVLASVGVVNPSVFKLPETGVISTGDELVEPSVVPKNAQIRNSNASQLESQIRITPSIHKYYGIAADDFRSLANIIEKAMNENDLVLLTGGVSMGDFDFVPAVMQELGIEILFKSIAIRPGKPTVFGRRDNKYIFGLPGNPVSSFVLFEVLVKPFLFKMMGHNYSPKEFILPMGCRFSRRSSERKSLIPVQIRDGSVFPVDYHGSAHINAFTIADAIMIMEIGSTIINQGDLVHVRPI